MNKLTKGTIAAVVGVGLLLGGGSTLAYWNSSSTLAASKISAGNLNMAADGTPSWTIQHQNGATTPVADISVVKLVPGDKLVYTGKYKITAQGQNLAFSVATADGSIAAVDSSKTADVAMAKRVAASVSYTINGVTGNTATIQHKDNASKDYPVVVAVTINWPFDAEGNGGSIAADNAAKLGNVNLSQFAVTATQVAPAQ